MLVLEINRISNPASYFEKTISLTPYQHLQEPIILIPIEK
jgi:hypothetical protein